MDDLHRYLKDPLFVQWINAPNDELEAYWRAWKEKNPDSIHEFEEAAATLKALRFKQYAVEEKAMKEDWRKVKAGTQKAVQQRALSKFFWAAAVMVMGAATAISLFLLNQNPKENDNPPISYIEKETQPGQKLTVQLPDGTLIKLNSGSTICYPEVFSDNLRKVKLTGEAYFEVTKDPNRPFVVEAGDITTKVLGTKFNVNGYNPGKVEVALVEGLVEVSTEVAGKTEKKQISPGEKVSWENNRFAVDRLNLSTDTGWKDNILSFHKSSIDEVKNTLERWYGVTIAIENAAQIPQSFNGQFQNESLANVLESIGFAMNFGYRIDSRNVYIKPINNDE